MSESPFPSQRPLLRWSLLAPALVAPLIASLFYFVFYPGTTFGNAFFTAIKIFHVLWPAAAVLLILREPLVDRTRPKRHLASLLPGTAFGLATLIVLFLLLQLGPFQEMLDSSNGRIAEKIRDLGEAETYFTFALFICFVNSALEEYYWRWFVFGQAKRLMPVPAAHFVAALGFSAHHFVVLSQFFPIGWALALGTCVGIGGAFWSWQAQRYNSLIGPWVSHLLVDIGIVWIGWLALQSQT